MIVTQKELALIFNITLRRVQQLQHDGIIQRDAKENGYKLEDCVPAYINYKVSSETGRKSAISKEEMQAKHEEVKMNISKLKLSRLRRDSLDANAVESAWADMLIGFKNKLKSLPSKIAIATAGKDINSSIGIVDEMISDALNDLANYDPKDTEDLGLDEFDDEDEGEGDDE